MTWDDIKNTLSMLDEPSDKLEMVMDIGARMDSVPDGAGCHEIAGCASRAEICIYDGNFYGRADSAIVRGILAIVLSIINGMDAETIRNTDIIGMFDELKLPLGAGRLNGLNSMVRFLKNL